MYTTRTIVEWHIYEEGARFERNFHIFSFVYRASLHHLVNKVNLMYYFS